MVLYVLPTLAKSDSTDIIREQLKRRTATARSTAVRRHHFTDGKLLIYLGSAVVSTNSASLGALAGGVRLAHQALEHGSCARIHRAGAHVCHR